MIWDYLPVDISFSHSQLLTSHHATRKAKQSKPNPAIIKTFMFKSGKKRSQAAITDVDGRMCTKSTTTEGKALSLVQRKKKKDKKTHSRIFIACVILPYAYWDLYVSYGDCALCSDSQCRINGGDWSTYKDICVQRMWLFTKSKLNHFCRREFLHNPSVTRTVVLICEYVTFRNTNHQMLNISLYKSDICYLLKLSILKQYSFHSPAIEVKSGPSRPLIFALIPRKKA